MIKSHVLSINLLIIDLIHVINYEFIYHQPDVYDQDRKGDDKKR